MSIVSSFMTGVCVPLSEAASIQYSCDSSYFSETYWTSANCEGSAIGTFPVTPIGCSVESDGAVSVKCDAGNEEGLVIGSIANSESRTSHRSEVKAILGRLRNEMQNALTTSLQ